GAATQQQQGEEPDPDPTCGSVEDVLAVLRDDYRRAYFLTGDFTPGIYTEDCLFEDPTIKFRGLSRYSQNLGLLVPFFDSPSLELENIEKGSRAETKFVKATWKLRFIFKLQKAHFFFVCTRYVQAALQSPPFLPASSCEVALEEEVDNCFFFLQDIISHVYKATI
ncbi:hypothetical protein ACJX0J_030345, partial [Zea mays]